MFELLRQYVYGGRYIDELACKIEIDGSETRMYYLQDVNYNVAALADTSGTMQERYNYEPYGTTTFTDANATGRPNAKRPYRKAASAG